jgi:hypothetical protein
VGSKLLPTLPRTLIAKTTSDVAIRLTAAVEAPARAQ